MSLIPIEGKIFSSYQRKNDAILHVSGCIRLPWHIIIQTPELSEHARILNTTSDSKSEYPVAKREYELR